MRILEDTGFFINEFVRLFKTPVFISLTVVGNGAIGFFGAVFYFIEKPHNPNIHHFIDAIWWAFSTATTTGYGDITPITIAGKIMGIFMMLLGTAIFATYTALFAEAILTSERFKRKP